MKKTLLIMLTCLFVTGYSFSQEETKAAQEGTPSPELAALTLANDLANYGYQNNSALSLAEAARILINTPTQELAVNKVEKGSQSKNEGVKTEKAAFTAENLLADAKDLAAGDATLLALISSIEKTLGAQTRGAVGGPKVGSGRVYARETDYYYVTFYGGTFCEVAVLGDGDTDLDLYIYDINGNLITYDDTYSGNCYAAFVPYYTSTFTIKVVNRGYVYNDYAIGTN